MRAVVLSEGPAVAVGVDAATGVVAALRSERLWSSSYVDMGCCAMGVGGACH